MLRHPGQTAGRTWTSGERLFYSLLLLSFIVAAAWDWMTSSRLLFGVYFFYIAVIVFRTLSAGLALFGKPEIVVTPKELLQAENAGWPFYTLLVPLYREPEVAAKTVRYLDKLDYPRDKLEVLLLLEQDDDLTRNALAKVPLPSYFRIIEVPDSQPRTKPKACNWGLREAKGEYLVIYDAEDRPDPDQLKKAAAAFRRVPEKVICLQAKLSYYNPGQNALTRWFTVEYAAWFDLYLPGLYRLKFPIPLGGTSNHFRRSVLEEIRGWDPFNVAEDCDLGIRLHRLGYRTAMLDTTTWEEANSRMRNWIRQRSRWVKGYLQTHLVHSRRPWRAIPELGVAGSFSFLMSVGGHSLVLLLNPLFWIAAVIDLLRADWSAFTMQGVPAFSITGILILANLLFIAFNALGCLRRKLGFTYVLFAIASPLYWVLISIAAWKGFVQLMRRPHYWEKTDHGLFPESDITAAAQ
jgi:glycosyltransferase XagB